MNGVTAATTASQVQGPRATAANASLASSTQNAVTQTQNQVMNNLFSQILQLIQNAANDS